MEGFAFRGFSYDSVLAKCGKTHRVEDLIIDFKNLTCTKAGANIALTKSMWRYLAVLISFNGTLVNRETLYRVVAGLDGGTNRSVDTFISMLRHTFGRHIETVHGAGYRWVDVTAPVKVVEVKAKVVKPIHRPLPIKKSVKKIAPVMVTPPLSESPERIYRVRGYYVQWNGEGTPPAMISSYLKTHGELPSFITLPLGCIRFTLEGHSVTWSGRGPLPEEIIHHLEEYQALPPWMRVRESNGRAA